VRRRLGWLGKRIGARSRACAAASAIGLGVAGWPAPATGAPLELAWSAPEGCPSSEEIVEATYARLEKDRTEAPAELFVRGTVARGDAGFVVTLVLEDVNGRSIGERIVRVDRRACAEIVTPTSVVLAMMIAVVRPRLATSSEPEKEPEERPAGQQAADAPPTHTPPTQPRRTAVAERPPPDRVSLGAVGLASSGVVPGLGLGFGIHASYFPGPLLFLRLEAGLESGSSVHVARGEVRFKVFSAGVRAGVRVMTTERFELVPTLEGRAGVIHTTAVGYPAGQNETRAVAAVGPGLLARLALGRSVVLEGLLDLELIPHRDRFNVGVRNKLVRIHQPDLVAPRFALGLAYDFR